MFHVPEKHRVLTGPMGSDSRFGNNGAFIVPLDRGQKVRIIASDGMMWDHVSVSRTDRCPTWEEMCQVKDIFWDKDDVVVQYHPAEKDYVNNHKFCLHMWRWQGGQFPVPEPIMVGVPEHH